MADSTPTNAPRNMRNPSTVECVLDLTNDGMMIPQKVPENLLLRLAPRDSSQSPPRRELPPPPLPTLRTIEVNTNEILQTGKTWYACRLYGALMYLNILCWRYMIQRKVRIGTIVYQILATASTLGMLGFLAAFDYGAFASPEIYFIACGVDAAFLGALGSIFALQLRRVLKCREQAAMLDVLYIIFLFLASVTSLYIVIILALCERYESLFLLVALFSIGMLENINMVVWILVFPALAVCFVLESGARLLTCSLRCPRREKLVRKFTFRPQLFNPARFQQPECAVCICHFESTDEICVLHGQHVFHVKCIEQWLARQNTCPICRREVALAKATAA